MPSDPPRAPAAGCDRHRTGHSDRPAAPPGTSSIRRPAIAVSGYTRGTGLNSETGAWIGTRSANQALATSSPPRPVGAGMILCRESSLANSHLRFKYGHAQPAERHVHDCVRPRRSTAARRAFSSTISSNAGTRRERTSATQGRRGPFSHDGIGELNPTLRRWTRIASGIFPFIELRAITLVSPCPLLLLSGNAITYVTNRQSRNGMRTSTP